jgi:hypothetical protein
MIRNGLNKLSQPPVTLIHGIVGSGLEDTQSGEEV